MEDGRARHAAARAPPTRCAGGSAARARNRSGRRRRSRSGRRLRGRVAIRQQLVPFRRWLNLTHSDTYLHGPFDFASVNWRKTRDRISQADWDILACQAHQFHNALPKFDMPSWSAHADCGVHVTFCDPSHVAALCAVSNFDDDILMP